MVGVVVTLLVGACLWLGMLWFVMGDGADSGRPERTASVGGRTDGRGEVRDRTKHGKAQRKPHRAVAKHPCPIRRGTDGPRKIDYSLLKKGTTLLVDTANMVGKLGPEHAADRLMAIATALNERGYRTCFYWERRSFDWARRKQADAKEAAALRSFVCRKDVSLVGEESDVAMLQAARTIADSVIVTQDRLRDYAAVYPDIVATARHRAYSLATVGGRTLLTIYGLQEAIEIPMKAEAPVSEKPTAGSGPAVVDEAVVDGPCEQDEDAVRCRAERPVCVPGRQGLLGVADACLARGDSQRAFALIGQVARRQPVFYREIADAFANGRGVPPDAWMASHYDRLADLREKAQVELRRRNQRRAAEQRRELMALRVAA